MARPLLLAAILLCNFAGMAWLAMAMKVHWAQVRGPASLPKNKSRGLRFLGVGACAAALVLCCWVDHPSMVPLVWAMSLTASALAVTFTLAFRPRWLSPLVAWVG